MYQNVKLEALIPWWDLEDRYAKSFKSTNKGEKALNVRIALGALIIQTMLHLTDRETVNQIMENPYLQYFLGFDHYDDRTPPFDASLMVAFRKRLSSDILIEINELIAKAALEEERSRKSKDKDDHPKDSGKKDEPSKDETPEHQGQLILDATCAPGDIHYPTDLRLLNEARENFEKIIDTLHTPDIGRFAKPRTSRKEARKNYLSLEKQRKKHKKAIRELYEQQETMYRTKTHKVENRIVSIFQPHLRPIVRGKAGADVEFGCKVLTSVVNGYSFVERMSFNRFNEGSFLIEAVENYRERFGCYPESVMADTIFRNRSNRAWLKEKKIRISGPKLGRPAKLLEKAQKVQEKLDTGIRNAIEGTYGNAKRKYGLARIKTKLAETTESSIILQFLVLNLQRRLQVLLPYFSWMPSKYIFKPKYVRLLFC